MSESYNGITNSFGHLRNYITWKKVKDHHVIISFLCEIKVCLPSIYGKSNGLECSGLNLKCV